MRHDGTIPSQIQVLENLNQQLNSGAKPRAIQQTEKELLFLFDDICASYLNATFEERVDVNIAFEFRGRLLAVMTTYFNNIAQQAFKASQNRRQQKTTIDLLQQGIAANMLVGPRVPESDIEEADKMMIQAATQIGFDMLELAKKLDIPAKHYVQRALQYHKGKQRAKALKSLSLALKANPQLENNDRVIALATTLTGETPISAMVTVSEGYVLRRFVEEIEKRADDQRLDTDMRPRSTLDVIRSWLT